jgi:hypothetical protein
MPEEVNKKLVDELDRLDKIKRDIEIKIENIKSEIVNIAKIENKNFLNGTHKKCSVKEYAKVVYPEDKETFAKLIKQKGLYDSFSQINYSRLSPAIIKRDISIGNDIINSVRIIKDFRVILIDKGI